MLPTFDFYVAIKIFRNISPMWTKPTARRFFTNMSTEQRSDSAVLLWNLLFCQVLKYCRIVDLMSLSKKETEAFLRYSALVVAAHVYTFGYAGTLRERKYF